MQDNKIHAIKISPIRADGEIGENFLLVKISAYTVFQNLVRNCSTKTIIVFFILQGVPGIDGHPGNSGPPGSPVS